MEQIEQPDVLYDFLYRDSNRIASYYSQIFRGHLSSMEKALSNMLFPPDAIRITPIALFRRLF